MQSKKFLNQLRKLILKGNEGKIYELVKQNELTQIEQFEFFDFVSSFNKKLQKRLTKCININGSGGSGIPKLNLTSIASIYVAAITKQDIVKTGSRANTGLCGSSDFFDEIGLLNIKNKAKAINKFHFAYFDYQELSPWKKYKNALKINKNIEFYLNNIIFFEYQAKIYGLGISDKNYATKIYDYQSLRFPKQLFTFYTKTKDNKIIDEICAGDVFLNNDLVFDLDIETYTPKTKQEILQEDIKLLNGDSTNINAYNSLKYSVSIYLLGMGYVDNIETAIQKFENAYNSKAAIKLINDIKKYCS